MYCVGVLNHDENVTTTTAFSPTHLPLPRVRTHTHTHTHTHRSVENVHAFSHSFYSFMYSSRMCMSGMSIFRFSAEFRFFFFLLLYPFFKNNFPLFWKNRPPKLLFFFFSFTDTATIGCSKSFGKQSVTSWFALLPFPV